MVILLSFSVFAIADLNVTGITHMEDYSNANGLYTYVGENTNSHNYWIKEAGASDYYIYFENGFDGWILIYEETDEHPVAGDSPNVGNYFARGGNYADGAEGSDYVMDGSENAVVNNVSAQGGGSPAPEFSDYAMILLIMTTVGGFFYMRGKV
ncbi:hypothetical protein HN385_00675 [archaeon]|nr:hypothetical protein [archaeon]MBT3450937.1 hypothetical protein [archaeon]MBT6869583.1 hypothetical protein [archaeon]MBT7381016.1 hypothetical protein [archaeon]MBT7508384.1 hypothetical protein [archaeon]